MKTLLFLWVGILLGIVAALIPSTNGHECYGCYNTDYANPNGLCWNNDPPSVRTKTCEGRCRTEAIWEETRDGKKLSIRRECTPEARGGHRTGCNGYLNEGKYDVICECDGDLCNNEPMNQIPNERNGNRLANGTILELPGGTTGEPGGGGPNSALAVLVGPTFGVLVMGLLVGVGGALLSLLFQ